MSIFSAYYVREVSYSISFSLNIFQMMSFNIIFPLTGIKNWVSLFIPNLPNVFLLKIDYVLQKLVVFWLNPLLTWPVSWMRVSIQSSAYSPREWQPRLLARELKLVNAFFAFVRIKKKKFWRANIFGQFC
jgi:hypothetical protein